MTLWKTSCKFLWKNSTNKQVLVCPKIFQSYGFRKIHCGCLMQKPKDPRIDYYYKKFGQFYEFPNVIKRVPSFKEIVLPPEEERRLKNVHKVPDPLVQNIKITSMPKGLHLIRGEEETHRDFIYKQYGIVADSGAFMRYEHFEVLRSGIYKKMNVKKCFAVWRVDPPWKPHTKKGIGKRMGGGKPKNVSFYSTPVKAKRVIIEVGGFCTFWEVKRMLDNLAAKMPFAARAMSHEMMVEERLEEERLVKENLNHWTFKYILQNNMLGSQLWAKKHIDKEYFCKYT